MSDELVDIVDSNNTVTGQVMKSEAHTKGLLHRTILAEIINSKGEWLLVKQAGDRQDAGQYVSPVGGHIRAGESEVDALKREAEEETGLKDFTSTYIGKAIWNRSVIGRQENHYFFLYEITSDQTPILNEESIEYRWFSKEDLTQEMKVYPELFGAAWWFVVKTFYPELID